MTSRKKSRTWINCEDGGKESTDELLVFGYSCKVFRDEEKAVYIDEGKHLIPWMGDKSLLIDRYDGRGYLPNLQEYEPSEEKDAAENFSEEEHHLEQLLEEERYMALQKNLTEEELYHEEELKRLRAALIDEGAYNQVGFSYEEQQQMALNGQKAADNEDQTDEDNEAFVPRAELNVPEGMEAPPTAKTNAIIEKTAMFVSRQGPQMEIVIKAKQSNNAQFSFLAFDHPLNPYYKHMVQAIKAGKYVPRPQANASDDDDGDSDGDHYLHPSLLASQPPQVLHVPKLSYAPTGKDPYALLVSQLKDKVYLGMHEQMQEGARAAANCTPPPAAAKPLSLVEPSPPPPPPGIAPVTLPQGALENTDGSFPPADLLPIVDKMASYVAKNGVDFEAIVKSKGADDRFEFLKPGHRFHTYYQYKRKMYEKQLQIEKENLLKEAEEKEAKLADKVVSFSIKMKEPGEKRNALVLVDNEEGENGVSEDGDAAVGGEEKTQSEATAAQEGTLAPESAIKVKVQSQEAKLAEERIRDRLAAAARERLVQVSREKQLQMERKRKAALFLTMLHKGKEEDANLIGPRLPNAAELEMLVDSESDLPLIPSFMNAPMGAAAAMAPTSLFQTQTLLLQPFAALSPLTLDPVTAAIQDKTVDALIRNHVSNSMKTSDLSSSPQIKTTTAAASNRHRHHHHHHRHKGRRGSSRSRSRSRSKSKHKSSSIRRRSRSRSRTRTRSRSRDRKNHKKNRRSRSRTRSKERKRKRRDRSREREQKTAADKRKSSRTPPAAYSSPRKSDSPRRGKTDRGKNGSSGHRDRRSRSRSASGRKSRDEKAGRDSSSSPSRRKKDNGRGSSSKQPSSSSRTKAHSRSRSRSRRPSRSPKKSRSPSRSRDSKSR